MATLRLSPPPSLRQPTARPQRYSYGVVLAAAAVGWLLPGWAAWVLGPALLLGLVLLGVAHGACDQYVVPATHPALARNRARYWVIFLGGYLGLAAAVGLLWWWWPALAVAFFFGLSAWHWGSGDAPAAARYRAQWLAHSLLRGGLIFALPLWFWPAETRALTNDLLALAGAAPVSTAAMQAAAQWLGPLVLAGHALLWASYCLTRQSALALTDMLEALLLSCLLVALPPVLSASVYFVFWHSLQHVLRMNAVMGRPFASNGRALWAELGFFLRRSAPLLAISVGALAVLYGLAWARAASGPALISLALLVASVVTLPHALLVTLGLDVARWRQR
ncbi:Brp/Blh family beta-carotene 15,15'-dioxygenase [Hymenobacter sp. H14-R3]|uniref:Brp/Blh family beta-carotene 15,15'-dioxygenase n=1 Tax=Hymenobacter sp. H14-R3 TaxID=3046308 RepID=UPI0024BA9F3A|nr:Brp/Blh family beta-carotene 15,15'-dioxygenase [Hymenobacter sp. H14-R3]MDJ0365066.1 Brp/Blh family beta-carotene 15,15'-dioxygenase [Hymenobacter sp. H14-R3]